MILEVLGLPKMTKRFFDKLFNLMNFRFSCEEWESYQKKKMAFKCLHYVKCYAISVHINA